MLNDGVGQLPQRQPLRGRKSFAMGLPPNLAMNVDDLFPVHHSSTSLKIERAPVAVTISVPSAAK